MLLSAKDHGRDGPSFSLGNRVLRAIWWLTWTLTARWTPPPLYSWRRLVLKVFGAKLAKGARVYGSTHIWLPTNLTMGEHALMGPRVNCYNQGHVDIGAGAVVSQGAHLCASTHDIRDPNFQLVLRAIRVGPKAWVAAEAFVGPGVTVGEGAVVAARAALFRDAEPWQVYLGNPASRIKAREMNPIEPGQ